MAAKIREVWADNLEAEMGHLRSMIESYPYVAMVCDAERRRGIRNDVGVRERDG